MTTREGKNLFKKRNTLRLMRSIETTDKELSKRLYDMSRLYHDKKERREIDADTTKTVHEMFDAIVDADMTDEDQAVAAILSGIVIYYAKHEQSSS